MGSLSVPVALVLLIGKSNGLSPLLLLLLFLFPFFGVSLAFPFASLLPSSASTVL